MSVMGTAWVLFLISLALRGVVSAKAPSLWVVGTDVAGFRVMLLGAWLGGSLVYHFKVGVDGA